MMRKGKYRIAAWLFAAVLAAGSLSGCGKKEGETRPETEPGAETEQSVKAAEVEVSAKELLTQVKENLSAASSVKSKLFMKMTMEYKAQGVEATLDCTMAENVEQVREPEAVHMTGTIDLNLAGAAVDTEIYTVKENDKYVTYTGTGGQWVKETTEQTDVQGNMAETVDLFLKNADDLTMEQVDTENGSPIYRVSGTITGENMYGILSTADSFIEENMDVYSNLKAKAVLLIDGSTGLPTEMTMDFTDSYNTFVQIYREAQGFDAVEITEFTISMSGYEVDTVAEIIVPDEIKQNAVDLDVLETDPDGELPEETKVPENGVDETGQNEQGKYVLGADGAEDENTAELFCPAGFTYDAGSEKNRLCFNSEENDSIHAVSLAYTLYTADDNYEEADLAQSRESAYTRMLASGDYAEVSFDGVQTVTASGRTVSYTKLSCIYLGTFYTEEYYAWTVLSDGRMVQCTVKEESREEPCSRIDAESVFDTVFGALSE